MQVTPAPPRAAKLAAVPSENAAGGVLTANDGRGGPREKLGEEVGLVRLEDELSHPAVSIAIVTMTPAASLDGANAPTSWIGSLCLYMCGPRFVQVNSCTSDDADGATRHQSLERMEKCLVRSSDGAQIRDMRCP